MRSFNPWAWADISSAVEESSSEEDAVGADPGTNRIRCPGCFFGYVFQDSHVTAAPL